MYLSLSINLKMCITNYQSHIKYIISYCGANFPLWIGFNFEIILWLFWHYVSLVSVVVVFFFFFFSVIHVPFLCQGRHRTPSEEETGTAVLNSASANLRFFRPMILWATHTPNWKSLLISVLIIFKKNSLRTKSSNFIFS